MKQEIIKYYWGEVITPLGRPSLVLVGQEFEDKMIVEKYILFEELNGKQSHIGEIIESPIIPNFSDNLQKFMDNQGLEHAKSTIYFEAFKEREKDTKRDYTYSDLKVQLSEANDTAFLMYFKRKAETHLNWINNSTSSSKLKALIELFKSFQITVRKLE